MERHRWNLPVSALGGLTAEKARDLILDCFFLAQRGTFLKVKRQVGLTRLDDTSLRADITGVMRLAFAEIGGDFDHPNPHTLRAVLGSLMRSAEAWGTPLDVIHHHAQQVQIMLERLEGDRRSHLGAPEPRRS